MSATRSSLGQTVADGAGMNRIIRQRVAERLNELAQLGHDWDSYGGLPPTEQAVATAGTLAAEVDDRFEAAAGMRTEPYNIAPLADGGIQVEWRGVRDALEAWVSPDGSLGYLLVEDYAGDSRYSEADIVSWEELLGLINQVLQR
jgi:hypothetical protein